MLQKIDTPSGRDRRDEMDHFEDPAADFIDIDRLLAAARRQWRVVVLSAVVAVLIGLAYVLTTVPLYTSSTSVIIDQGNSRIVDQLSAVGGLIEDEASVLSQVELLKSEKIAYAVVDKLRLTEDPAFMSSDGSVIGTLIGFVKSVLSFDWLDDDAIAEVDQEAMRRAAVSKLQRNMDVQRVGRTYVLQLSYTSPLPGQAAQIASAYAEAYLTDQLDSKYEATRRASAWLQQRIEELRQKSLETDLAVQRFRTENGLIATGGQLVTDQNLSELSSQLIVAQADSARAKARYDRIRALVDTGQTSAVVSDALDSSVINTLRQKYLDSSKREAEITSRLGPNHIQAVRLRAEMKEYERLMFEELSRIADSYLNDYEVAKAREDSLRDSVGAATGITSTANETLVQLRELERESETFRSLYQTFLQRYQEAVQQQSFPITEARVITQATVPQRPSFPKTSLVLALSLVLGSAAGVGIGAFREFRDRFFRTADQVRDELGQEFLGFAPLVGGVAADQARTATSGDEVHPRVVRKGSAVSNYTVDHPMSAFAETMRSAKIAADIALLDRKPKVIGVVSVLPGEGKSTIAINLAELLASQGARTLLIDADLRNPGTTRAIARHATAGLVEAIVDGRPIRELLLVNPTTKLAVLPSVVKHRVSHTSEYLASPGMAAVLRQAEDAFDYVIVDLPPLAPVVDVRAVASRMDAFVFVVEWGRTARRMVRTTLRNEPQVYDKCLGVVLNKADTDKMKLYRSYGSSEYYYSRYSSYYQTNHPV